MRKTNFWLAIVFAISSVFVSQIVSAADPTMKSSDMSQHSMSQQMFTERVSKMMDKTVKDPAGQALGKIEDFVLGHQGRTSFVILSANDKLYPIPFQALHQGAREDELVANISKDKFNNAPSFSKNQWPDFSSTQWEQSVFSYYGEQAPSRTPSSQRDTTQQRGY